MSKASAARTHSSSPVRADCGPMLRMPMPSFIARPLHPREVNQQVAAQVPDELGDDVSLAEAPLAGKTRKMIAISPRDDGLQREVRQRLIHGEIRTGARGGSLVVD